MTNVITFPARPRITTERNNTIWDLSAKRTGDSIELAKGKTVYVMAERHNPDGSRDLLLFGIGDKQWVPDTLFIQSSEHIA